MIRHGKDFIQWMNWEEKKTKQNVQKTLFLDLSEKEKQVFSCLEEALTLDELSLKSKQPIATTATILLQLELKGAVRSIGGINLSVVSSQFYYVLLIRLRALFHVLF